MYTQSTQQVNVDDCAVFAIVNAMTIMMKAVLGNADGSSYSKLFRHLMAVSIGAMAPPTDGLAFFHNIGALEGFRPIFKLNMTTPEPSVVMPTHFSQSAAHCTISRQPRPDSSAAAGLYIQCHATGG